MTTLSKPTEHRGSKPKFTLEEFGQLYAEKYSGMSYEKAAADLKIAVPTYRNYVLKLKGSAARLKPGHPPIFTPEEFRQLYAEKCAGLNITQAARAIGLSLSAYRRYLAEMRKAAPTN